METFMAKAGASRLSSFGGAASRVPIDRSTDRMDVALRLRLRLWPPGAKEIAHTARRLLRELDLQSVAQVEPRATRTGRIAIPRLEVPRVPWLDVTGRREVGVGVRDDAGT